MDEKPDSWLMDEISAVTLKSLLENPNMLMPTHLGRGNGQGGCGKKKGLEKTGHYGSHGNPTCMSAFLGPKLWDSTLPDDDDLKFEYLDLEEFLSEHGISGMTDESGNVAKKADVNPTPQTPPIQDKAPTAVTEGSCIRKPQNVDNSGYTAAASSAQPSQQNLSEPMPMEAEGNLPPSQECQLPPESAAQPYIPSSTTASSPQEDEMQDSNSDIPFEASTTDVALATAPGEQIYNPREKRFSDAELKPQPMIKKSRKVFVPDERKDGKYWERRRKNNIAAKRSRDARRIKENQIVLRASFLETQNGGMKDELTVLKEENMNLKKLVSNLEKQLRAVHDGN